MVKVTRERSRLCRKSRAAVTLFHHSQAGYSALVAVLVVLAFGAIILVPLLGFMITGQKAGNQVQERTGEYYSADAGVENAIAWLQSVGIDNPDDPNLWVNCKAREDITFAMNGDEVVVSIEDERCEHVVYRITSKATDIVTGKSTTIVARVKPSEGFQGSFFGNAITAKGDVNLSNEELIYGDVQCSGNLTLMPTSKIYGDVRCRGINNYGTIYGSLTYTEIIPPKGIGTVTGAVTWSANPPVLEWPEHCALDAYYDERTSMEALPATISAHGPWEGRTTISGSMPDLVPCIDPPPDSKKPGDAPGSLTIDLKTSGVIVELDGNILIYGDLVVEGLKAELDLNGHTIYVRGEVYIAPGAKITGAGLIIAIGNIDAQPNLSAGGSKYAAAVVHYNGNTANEWATKTITETYLLDLNDVWGVSSGASDTVYAVGNGCEVQKYTGPANGTGAWNEIDISGYIPARPNLSGIWGVDASHFYAVGDDGHIVTYDGTWSYLLVTTADLNGVWGSAADNVFAVGNGGTIMHYDGSSWSAMNSGVTDDLYGVHGTSDNVVFAVGKAGTILRYDGGEWVRFPISAVETSQNLRAVWVSSATDAFAVGDGGTIVRYNGVKWLKEASGTASNLRDVYGTADGPGIAVFAVGESAVARKWTATTGWVGMVMEPGMTRALNGVWGSSSADVYAVGATKGNYMFFMSVNGTISLQPANNSQFLGGIAGAGDVTLRSNQTLAPSSDVGEPSYPKYRTMVILSYVITMG
ncbi:MAG: hypothetical protein QUS33_12375 [Dehalococcoidia bacterium]|nr:hypothetical protein [Dehalococcoidia bacterium]